MPDGLGDLRIFGKMARNFYQLIDHTADIGIEVTAHTKGELFTKVACAFCDLRLRPRTSDLRGQSERYAQGGAKIRHRTPRQPALLRTEPGEKCGLMLFQNLKNLVVRSAVLLFE